MDISIDYRAYEMLEVMKKSGFAPTYDMFLNLVQGSEKDPDWYGIRVVSLLLFVCLLDLALHKDLQNICMSRIFLAFMILF